MVYFFTLELEKYKLKPQKDIPYIDKQGNVQDSKNPKSTKDSEPVDYVKYMNIGFYLAAPLLISVFLGLKLDDIFHTKPTLTLSLIVLGAAATFYNLIKLTKDA